MDRRIVYVGAIPQDSDVLYTNRYAMISDGWVAQGILGIATLFSGLACTPTSPAGMTVNVAPGAVFSQQNIDNSAYGSLSPDTADQVVKVGINQSTQNFSCPAPVTAGQSVVYLIEAAFVEQDTGSVVLPYYNAANPTAPFNGPNNSGISQNTIRQDVCSIQVKVGVPATTGLQAIPAPDAGYTGLYAITVANGQTTIVSGNISIVSGAPFITETLTQKISQATGDARYAMITGVQNNSYAFGIDTSVSANTLTVNLSPAPSVITQGMTLIITVANNNTGASTINVNGLGAKSITKNGGNALTGGELQAGQNVELSYNGSAWNLLSQTTPVTTVYAGSGSTTGTANAQVLATVTPGGFSLVYGDAVTFTAGFTNTGAMTINVSSSGAITIKKKNSGGGLVDLAASDIVATDIYQIIYDGTYWELNSQSFPAASTFFQTANNLSEGVLATKQANLGIDPTSFFSTGDVKLTLKTVADTGWVMCNDQTIGSAASSAAYANANAQALFTLLWNNVSNTYAPVSSGRGANAAADWAANKTIQLTQMMGRALGISGAGAGLTARTLGQTFGNENLQTHTHTATVTDPTHQHSMNAPASAEGQGGSEVQFGLVESYPAGISGAPSTPASTGITVANANTGTGTAGNMQPTLFLNAMIKL